MFFTVFECPFIGGSIGCEQCPLPMEFSIDEVTNVTCLVSEQDFCIFLNQVQVINIPIMTDDPYLACWFPFDKKSVYQLHKIPRIHVEKSPSPFKVRLTNSANVSIFLFIYYNDTFRLVQSVLLADLK